MGLREELLERILSFDARRLAEVSLRPVQGRARARSAAVVVIEGDRYVLFASTELYDDDLRRIADTWRSAAPRLRAGAAVADTDWTIVPLGAPVAGLLYLGQARALSTALLSEIRAELVPILEAAIAVRDQESELERLYRLLLAKTRLKDFHRDQLLLLMRMNGWNKSRVADILEIERATLYKWLRKHRIDDEDREAS